MGKKQIQTSFMNLLNNYGYETYTRETKIVSIIAIYKYCI